jgi:hypothetical protein
LFLGRIEQNQIQQSETVFTARTICGFTTRPYDYYLFSNA